MSVTHPLHLELVPEPRVLVLELCHLGQTQALSLWAL